MCLFILDFVIIKSMKETRIVFMGTPDFAAHVLTKLIENDYNIVGVVTQQDKKVGRKQILTPPPVKVVAKNYNIPVFQPYRIRKEFDDILKLEPELIITCAYGQIIPKELLDYPKHKCINTHASLLPKYRGGAPVQWSIINGEKETGISIMYMNEKMDEGDILYQKSLDIDIKDTSTSLFNRLAILACEMLIDFLPSFLSGDFKTLPQDNNLATYAYNLKKEDEFISFDDDVLTVYNHIRGLLDNPGAYGIINDKKIKFLDVDFTYDINDEPGKFLGLVDSKIAIACKNGAILVNHLQQESKKAINAKDFYNGVGKNLENKYFEKH